MAACSGRSSTGSKPKRVANSFGSVRSVRMFNSYVVFGIGLSNFVAKYPCVIGKSMLLRREVLDKIGGFAAFENVLAEDYLIGHSVDAVGYRVVTSTFPITTINKMWTFRNVWSRHLRWAQIRKSLGWRTFLLEPLLLPHLWLLLLAIQLPMIAALAYIALTLSEAVAVARWSCQKPTLTLLAFVGLRQFLQYALWLTASVKRHVTWRGKRYRLYKGSRLCASHLMPPRRKHMGTEDVMEM